MNPAHFSFIMLPLMGSSLYAQAPTVPVAVESPAHAPLQADPQLISGTLPNGLHYLIRPTKEPAGQASMRLYVNTGSLNESEETKGISHFIEHMVFNGSRHFKRGELIPAMQNLGLGFGGDANAYTGLLQTVYMLDLPNLKPETVDFALTIMRDFADGATLTDEAIDHERGIIVSELKARDSESYRAGIATLRHFVGGSRVPDYLPIGTEEVIRNCPYDTIRQYYRENYVPERMTFIISGDIDPRQAEEWVKQHFASMEARPAPTRPAIGSPSSMGAGSCVIPNAETANSSISIAVVNPWQHREDTLEQRVADIPLQLACSMLNRRLARVARQEDSPFLAASVTPKESIYEAAELFSLGIRCQPGQWQAALGRAENELRRAATFGFSETELQEAIATIRANCSRATETWETISSKTMADALVDSLADKRLFTSPAEDSRAFAAGIAHVLANPSRCHEALQQAYEADRTRLSLSGNIPEGATAEALAATYATIRQQEVSAQEEQELEPFAYDTIGTPGSIVNQNCHEDIGVTTLTLSNGVRVNLKPIEFKRGNIAVSAAVDGGSLRLAHTPALAHMADAVMAQGGLEAHSADDLNRLFAGNNVSCHFGMDEQRFLFSGTTTPRDLELQCKLLCAAILHPGYRSEGEVQLRRALPAFFRSLETTPSGAYARQSAALLFGGDSRFLTPTPEQFAAVNTSQVKTALEPWLTNGAMEVTLVGDFKVDEVLPILERSFGAMPQRAPEFTPLAENERRVAFRPWGQREFLRYETGLDKTIVTQVRPAGNGRDLHRNRRLAVLTAIVRERLFDAIRAELGESYSPSVRCELRTDYDHAATLTAASFGVKRNREKVTAAMDIVFTTLGKGEITEAEFQQALRPYIADADESYRQPTFWAGSISRLQSEPERLDLLRDFRDDARNISLEEIRQLAREIFGDPEKVNYYFTVPQDYKVPGEHPAEEETEAAPAESGEAEAPATQPQAAMETGYAILCSTAVAQDPAWYNVVLALAQKHAQDGLPAPVGQLDNAPKPEDANKLARLLQLLGSPRHVAVVLKPEEIGREVVNALHRTTRMVDDDPWGDCIWGIVTGATAQDALRLATANEPLILKRLLATTNVSAAPFEHSYCITDWTNSPVRAQSGYSEPQMQEFAEGEGREHLFAEQLATQKPQFIVTSSHATQFNLEMPFGKGLIFPAKGKFHQLTARQMPQFGAPLAAAMQGKSAGLDALTDALHTPAIEPDGEARVWLAAGNCLFGNAQHSASSMAVTALSAYTCNQVIGYTVPSWYGKGGWGTLSLFFENTDGTSLAEAWYLNNQFILEETQRLAPGLLQLHFNDDELSSAFLNQALPAIVGLGLTQEQAKDALGLVHDRDVVAFYGDPAWRASVDSSHCPRPFRVEWHGEKSFTITANSDRKGRAAIWFPTAATGKGATGCDAPGALFTNDFILFPELEMKKGETRTVTIH